MQAQESPYSREIYFKSVNFAFHNREHSLSKSKRGSKTGSISCQVKSDSFQHQAQSGQPCGIFPYRIKSMSFQDQKQSKLEKS